jgi:RNA polymerase sigma-70 factor (ECF subfamily)
VSEAEQVREERFEAMFREQERRVFAYALRRADAELARDAVADAFLAAWRRFDELPEDPLPWLLAATRKTLANQRRSFLRQALVRERLRREPPLNVEAHGSEPVLTAFGSLSAREQEVLALVAWEGLAPAQAARVLGISAVAFRVRLHRARRRLERALAQSAEQDPSLRPARAHAVEELSS